GRGQFGRRLREAVACGAPVVGSDSGEIPHVLRGAGVVVGEDDLPAWVRTLDGLLEAPARQRELAERGLSRALDFSWPAVARQHLDFFERILSDPNRQTPNPTSPRTHHPSPPSPP